MLIVRSVTKQVMCIQISFRIPYTTYLTKNSYLPYYMHTYVIKSIENMYMNYVYVYLYLGFGFKGKGIFQPIYS